MNEPAISFWISISYLWSACGFPASGVSLPPLNFHNYFRLRSGSEATGGVSTYRAVQSRDAGFWRMIVSYLSVHDLKASQGCQDFGHRQSDHVGVGASNVFHQRRADSLNRVGAGLIPDFA